MNRCDLCQCNEHPILGCNCVGIYKQLDVVLEMLKHIKENAVATQDFPVACLIRDGSDKLREAANLADE